MVIVSKDKTSLANMEYIASIYIAGDWSVKANMNGNVSMIKLGHTLPKGPQNTHSRFY